MRRRPHRISASVISVVLALAVPNGIRADTASVTATVQVGAVLISLDLSASEATLGHPIRARATVTNVGDATLSDIAVELRSDADGIRIRGAEGQVIARLRAGRHETLSWTLCGRQVGSYVLLARVTVGGLSLDSEARVVSVLSDKAGKCT